LKEWALEQGWERPPGQPGSGIGHPDRGAWRARDAFGIKEYCFISIDKFGSM
jgi:hypothetical protein